MGRRKEGEAGAGREIMGGGRQGAGCPEAEWRPSVLICGDLSAPWGEGTVALDPPCPRARAAPPGGLGWEGEQQRFSPS